MTDWPRCSNCAFAGKVQLNSSRRRVTTEPKVLCTHWGKLSHPYGVCPDHQPKQDDAPVVTVDDATQIPLI